MKKKRLVLVCVVFWYHRYSRYGRNLDEGKIVSGFSYYITDVDRGKKDFAMYQVHRKYISADLH